MLLAASAPGRKQEELVEKRLRDQHEDLALTKARVEGILSAAVGIILRDQGAGGERAISAHSSLISLVDGKGNKSGV